jgi:hypothetical protein
MLDRPHEPPASSMNRALYLHIGHHRTGTTYLQKHVFPKLRGLTYFFKGEKPEAQRITNAFLLSPAIWRACGERLVAPFARLNSSVLLSRENMSSHRMFARPGVSRRRDPFLLAAHLRECRRVAERFGLALKVILGIRRQDQYFGSRYAAHGRFASKPSQSDFERQVKEIIDPEQRYFLDGIWLDYAATRDLIADEIGEEALLILPLEQLDSDRSRYLASLSAFLQTDVPHEIDEVPANVRAVGEDSWLLTTNVNGRRTDAGTITLSDSLRDEILVAYRDSNRRLTEATGIDFASYYR